MVAAKAKSEPIEAGRGTAPAADAGGSVAKVSDADCAEAKGVESAAKEGGRDGPEAAGTLRPTFELTDTLRSRMRQPPRQRSMCTACICTACARHGHGMGTAWKQSQAGLSQRLSPAPPPPLGAPGGSATPHTPLARGVTDCRAHSPSLGCQCWPACHLQPSSPLPFPSRKRVKLLDAQLQPVDQPELPVISVAEDGPGAAEQRAAAPPEPSSLQREPQRKRPRPGPMVTADDDSSDEDGHEDARAAVDAPTPRATSGDHASDEAAGRAAAEPARPRQDELYGPASKKRLMRRSEPARAGYRIGRIKQPPADAAAATTAGAQAFASPPMVIDLETASQVHVCTDTRVHVSPCAYAHKCMLAPHVHCVCTACTLHAHRMHIACTPMLPAGAEGA